ncbi:hypothetical protein AQULUS_24610 (plasmid) [Aquicella lusitana]|uniref:Uncharacterized protein n=1 Tax=Aquicella lusitana TaxID=254246 RepID=A0A370G3Z9_9COXI|nr:hypothetical protein C8D86_1389 [Aquicella lusitana]VVC74695.1 hypothetical protein AQULUS_24610 [Aquicella lusitana]
MSDYLENTGNQIKVAPGRSFRTLGAIRASICSGE